MSKKIENPIVLIHKRENSDSYAGAITSGSHGYSDAVLMASMDPGMHGNDIDTWSKTGYYMAAEIEQLREKLKLAEEKHLHLLGVADDYDWQRQRLYVAAEKIIRWNRQEAADRTGNAEDAESYACVRELRDALAFCDSKDSPHASIRASQEYPETLPCPVILEPGFRFGKGVSTHLVLRALKNRAARYAELDSMGPEARAEHDAAIAELREKLGFGAPAKTAVQIKLPGLPKLGSDAEWYQGFAAGAGGMREACAAALISAGVEIIGETK